MTEEQFINKYLFDWGWKFVFPKAKDKKYPVHHLGDSNNNKYTQLESYTFRELKDDLKKKHDGLLVYLPKSHLLMVDVDNKNSMTGSKDLERMGFKREDIKTFITKTPSGGRHFLYERTVYFDKVWRENGGQSAYTGFGFSKGVELKINVITSIPPTKGYDCIYDIKPQPIPDSMVDVLFKEIKKGKVYSSGNELIPVNKVSQGNRNNQLYARLSFYLRESGGVLTLDELGDKAKMINSRFLKPLPYDEVISTVNSVHKIAERIYSITSLDKYIYEGRQRLVAEDFLNVAGDFVFYAEGYDLCYYDDVEGYWRVNQRLFVCNYMISNFIESLITLKTKDLKLRFGNQIEFINKKLDELNISETMEVMASVISDDDISKQKKSETQKQIKIIKDTLKVKDELLKQIRTQLSPFIKMGKDSECNAIGNFVSALTMKRFKHKAFNPNPHHVNFTNGTYDLDRGEFREHFYGDYIDYPGQCKYDANHKCPEFLNFMKQIMKGDEDSIQYLQMLFGFCMSGLKTGMQKIIIFTGSGGNGKGVLTNAIHNVMGQTIGTYDPDTFFEGKSNNNRLYDLASNRNKRLMWLTEFPDRAKVNKDLLKKITGDDMVKARFSHKDYFEYKPVSKTIITSNTIPRLGDQKSMKRRIVVVPFNQDFTTLDDEEDDRDDGIIDMEKPIYQDPKIDVKLKKESSGIANWMIDGFKMYKRRVDIEDCNPFDDYQSDVIRSATKDYMGEVSQLVEFIRTHYQIYRNISDDKKRELENNNQLIPISEITKTINQTIGSDNFSYKERGVKNTLKGMGVKVVYSGSRSDKVRVWKAYIHPKDYQIGY